MLGRRERERESVCVCVCVCVSLLALLLAFLQAPLAPCLAHLDLYLSRRAVATGLERLGDLTGQ